MTLLLFAACSEPRSSNLQEPDVLRFDPPRGVQIDVPSGAPAIRCEFAPAGGPRRILLYNQLRPDALWKYFAASRWRLAGYCENKGKNGDFIRVATRGPLEKVWLITAWDSLSHGSWGQLERYDLEDVRGEKRFTFGHPNEEALSSNLVTAAVLLAPRYR